MADDDKTPEVEKLSEEDLEAVSGGLGGPGDGGLGEAGLGEAGLGEAL